MNGGDGEKRTPPSVEFFVSLDLANQRLAGLIAALSEEAVARNGVFSLVLAGGRTPAGLYRLLAADPHASRIAWPLTHLFWGDERFVAANHPDSNFYLAHSQLLRHVPVLAENIHQIPATVASPAEAAKLYQEEVARFLGAGFPGRGLGKDGEQPLFDCVLLGMGEDGHVASLFPGHPLLAEEKLLVAAVPEPAGNPLLARITMTLPAIARSRHVFLVISGRAKRAVAERILAGKGDQYPASLVRSQGGVVWFVAEE